MKPSCSKAFTRARQGEGDRCTLSARSTFAIRAFSCNADRMFQSMESSSDECIISNSVETAVHALELKDNSINSRFSPLQQLKNKIDCCLNQPTMTSLLTNT